METLAALGNGFAVALVPMHLLFAFVGAVLGTAVGGGLPGIGPALTVALLLPVTYQLAPTASFIMFAGVYYGAMYGGSTTSILINTPGESASIITALDGNQMARRSRGAAALATAALGSFVAGTLGAVGLTFSAPLLVEVALAFGPAEYFALMVLAFTTVSAVLGASRARGLISLFFGLGLGLIGIDTQTGQARFTLGIPALFDGVGVVIVVVGLFAVGETLYVASRFRRGGAEVNPIRGSLQSAPELVWGLIPSLYIGNVMLLVLKPLAPLWVRLLMIPRPLLYGSILVFALLGAYAANGSVVDVAFLVVIGLIGYAMRVFDFPVAPVLVGMILGPLSEQQLRRALAISQGSPIVFLTRPVSAALLLVAIGILVAPLVIRRLRAR